jgi:hypothetical protein
MNIKIVQMITQDYIICDLEELDEEPSVYMKNPYKIDPLTYWDYKEEDKHFPPDNAVFLKSTVESNIKDGNETVTTQTDYAQLEQYPPFTNDRDVLFNSDRIMTVFDPTPEIVNLYTQLISK